MPLRVLRSARLGWSARTSSCDPVSMAPWPAADSPSAPSAAVPPSSAASSCGSVVSLLSLLCTAAVTARLTRSRTALCVSSSAGQVTLPPFTWQRLYCEYISHVRSVELRACSGRCGGARMQRGLWGVGLRECSGRRGERGCVHATRERSYAPVHAHRSRIRCAVGSRTERSGNAEPSVSHRDELCLRRRGRRGWNQPVTDPLFWTETSSGLVRPPPLLTVADAPPIHHPPLRL